MGKLYLMVTIVDRKIGKKYQSLYKENEHHVMFSSLGFGTAASEILNYLGLEATEKAVIFSVQEEEKWLHIKSSFKESCGSMLPEGGLLLLFRSAVLAAKSHCSFFWKNRIIRKRRNRP